MPLSEKRLYPIAAAAERLGIGRTTAYVLMNEGKLRSVRVAGRRLISSDEIARFIDDAERASA